MEKSDRNLSRRGSLLLLGGGAVAVGAVVVAPRGMISQPVRELVRAVPVLRPLLSLANAGYAEWLAQVGSTFAVAGGTRMSLIGVQPLTSSGRRPAGLRDRAFVAAFNVLGRATMASDLIYTASHPQYGPLQIFLTGSTNPATPSRMLAVFN